MAVLEQVNLMKQQGYNDNQIATALKEQGISQTEINEALSQSKIKEAITGGMQPSMMQGQIQNYGQQYAAEVPQYPQQAVAQEQYAQYPQEQYYPQADVATIREIAKQEVETALKEIRKELESLEKIKTELNYNVQSMDNRLKKIEAVIQDLQSAIIRKIGEYGEAISGISEEIKATQDSFSKIINPLLDKKRGIEENSEEIYEEETEKKPKPKGKARAEKSDGFESYLGR